MTRFFLFNFALTYVVFSVASAVSYYIRQRDEWREQRAMQPKSRPVLSRDVIDRSR